jgi:RNA polymerase sigma-70 factor (ECF subfamily)
MDELVEMCEREHPRLVGMLGLYCGDVDVAEDLAQEALIRLCRHWRRVRKMDSPDRWLHRVAVNLAHSHFRKRALDRRVTSLVRPRQAEVPNTDVEALQLLQELPHRQKACVVLHYYLDLPLREVAQVMDMPEGTVKTLIHRAKKRLTADELSRAPDGI